jgi:hypothetical protein
MEILKLKHEIQLLKLQLQQKDEIIAFMTSSPEQKLEPLKPIELPSSLPCQLPSPKLSINENTAEIFKKCLFIDSNCNTTDEWFQKGYFNEELSIFQTEINDFIQCHIEERDWKHRIQFDLYKKEVLGKNTYQEVKANAKIKGMKILNDKRYVDESMDKISNIMTKLNHKVYESIIPPVLIPEFYVEEALCTFLQDLMNQESRGSEHLTSLDLVRNLT